MKTVNVRYPSNLSILGAILLDKELYPAMVEATGNLALTQDNEFVEVTAAATVTLPTAVENQGMTIVIKNSYNGAITINTVLSQTIDGNLSIQLLHKDAATLISNGANWLII